MSGAANDKPSARSPAARADAGCPQCGKPTAVCVCDRIVALPCEHAILILQHPQEQDVDLGSAPLVLLSIARAERAVGLSWRSLAHALDREVDASRYGVLYPSSLKRALTAAEKARPFLVLDRSGNASSPDTLDGVIVLDGTWSQAKALWWRNAWLLKLPRVLVHPREPSIYGKARKEPRREYVSTLEAVALTLDGLGEDPATGNALRRLFRTMVQRARDAARP